MLCILSGRLQMTNILEAKAPKMHRFAVALFCVLLGLIASVCGQGNKITQSEDGQSGTISFSTPTLSDDDAHSPWMPDQLKCDACKIVAFQLHRKFTKVNNERKSYKYNLKESDIIQFTEEVCNGEKTWESYGLKEVKKVKKLSGPGTDVADEPGIMQGGGKWPGRLSDMCGSYMGDIGEEKIYNVWKKNPTSRKRFENFLCRGKGILGECTRAEQRERDEL